MRFNPIISNPSPAPAPKPAMAAAEGAAAVERVEQAREGRRNAFLTNHALSPEPVTVADDEMAIVLRYCWNDSYSQGDHFNYHASFGELLLGKCRKGARTEKRARAVIELYPDLAKLNWKWHVEDYSGGHGNYLMSGSVDYPFDTGVKKYITNEPVTYGHYEIVFEYPGSYYAYKNYPGNLQKVSPRIREGDRRPGIQLLENREKQGLELHFPNKPSDAIRDQLKGAGWRWSRFGNCWYIRQSDEARAWADTFMSGLNQPPTAETSPSREQTGQNREQNPDEREQITRAELIKRIVAVPGVEKRNRYDLVQRGETKGTDGRYYHLGFPRGVESTGEHRHFWVLFCKSTNTTVGMRAESREALQKAFDESIDRQADTFRGELVKMSDEKLLSQANCWLKQDCQIRPETAVPVTFTPPAAEQPQPVVIKQPEPTPSNIVPVQFTPAKPAVPSWKTMFRKA